MVVSAKQSKLRERSQGTSRDIGYVLATLALARVVTRDLVVSQNKNCGRNPSWSYVKPVVTRGSTVVPCGQRHTDREERKDGRTDSCDEANSCFSQFCERA
jgi:hypothetical protein